MLRPSMTCSFSINDGEKSGRVTCVITDVLDPITDVFWEFDQDTRVPSPGAQAPYIATHDVSYTKIYPRVMLYIHIQNIVMLVL